MDESQSLNTRGLLGWVGELAAGRPNAAEPTLRKVVAKVEGFARASFARFPRVGRFADVEDVVQNTLVRLLAALREVRPTSTRHFYALANQLVRRELVDQSRRLYGPRGAGTRTAPVALGDGDGQVAPAVAGPGHPDLDRLAWFHEAVEKLPAEEREAVGLTYYHGWGQQKIADLFGVSVRTVQRWLEGATEKLRAGAGS